MKNLLVVTLTLTLALSLAASVAAAADLAVVGLFPTKAVVVVNGASPKTIAVGQRTAEGVTLVEVGTDSATFEIDGKRRVLRMGQHYAAPRASEADKVVLKAGAGGHFIAPGTINGGTVQFLVDTGATLIAISKEDAKRLGINYLDAPKSIVATANGNALAYDVRLDTVTIGAITINSVQAVVLERGLSTPLLGMSFLARTNMVREGETLTLVKRF